MITRTLARITFRCCATLASACFAVIACVARADAQLYKSSVVGTDFDFITESDPSLFEKIEFVAQQQREMADKRPDTPELMKQAYVFEAHFRDTTRVFLVIDAAFGSQEAAQAEAMRYVHPLGKLPTSLRKGIDRGLVVHKGGEEFTAFSDRGLIIVYSDNATKRIGTHDLEETIFHESIHASWDETHRASEGWTSAQAKDGAFITAYAQKKSDNEDLAESALFAYTLLHHPERIPAEEAKRIRETIPNRIAYIAKLLPPGEPVFTTVQQTSQPLFVQGDSPPPDACRGNIRLRGILADILANALRIDFNTQISATELISLANDTKGETLFRAVVAKYNLDPEKLKQSIRRHQHINCKHGPVDNTATDEELARWKAAPKNDTAPAQPSRAVTPDDAARGGTPQTDMINVVSELRRIFWILIVGVFSNVILITLLFHRLKTR